MGPVNVDIKISTITICQSTLIDRKLLFNRLVDGKLNKWCVVKPLSLIKPEHMILAALEIISCKCIVLEVNNISNSLQSKTVHDIRDTQNHSTKPEGVLSHTSSTSHKGLKLCLKPHFYTLILYSDPASEPIGFYIRHPHQAMDDSEIVTTGITSN